MFLAFKKFQDLCPDKVGTENTTVVSYINKEWGWVHFVPYYGAPGNKWQVTLKAQHIPGRLNVVADKLSRLGQTIQTEWSFLPEVFQIPINLQQVAPASNRFICHKVQQQVTSVCVTGTGPSGLSSGCTEPVMGGSGRIYFPTCSWIRQSGGEVAGLSVQETHSECSRVAQHDLVLGYSGHVQPNLTQSAKSSQPAITTLQSDPSQKPDKTKSPCMAPRGSAKEYCFSEAVAAWIEAHQRGSTRSVYEAKWTIFTKWYLAIRCTSGHPL